MYGKFKKICYNIAKDGMGEPPMSYRAILSANNQAITVLKVHSLTRTYNVEESIAVVTHLTAAVPTSQFVYLMSGGNGAIKVKLSTHANNRHLETEMLFGINTTPIDTNLTLQTNNIASADDMSISIVTLELYSEPVWLNRLRSMGTTFNNETPLTAAKYIIGSLTNSYLPNTAANSMVYEEEEQKHYHSIQIPDHTPFLGIFDYIQNHYGLYSKGIAVCLHKQTWRLFMPYDDTKYNQDKKRLCVYAMNPEHGSQFERSLKVEGNTYHLVTTALPVTTDNRDLEALNGGTGYHIASVRALDARAGSLDSNTINVTTPEAYLSGSNPNPHKSGLTNASFITERFKDDDKSIASEFHRKRGIYVKVPWQRSMYGLLYPGMGVKYLYATEGGIVERYGVLIGEVYHTAIDGGMIASNTYVSESELLLWIV